MRPNRSKMPFRKNDYIELKITAMAHDGVGIGKYNSVAVFVPQTALGDLIVAKILKVAKNCAYAKLEEIIEPSKDRIEQVCPVFNKCGGCVYRHVSDSAQKFYKYNRVSDCINRIGGLDIEIDGLVSPSNRDRYRNKAQYPFSLSGKVGLFAAGSHRVVEHGDCLLQPMLFSEICRCVEKWVSDYNIAVYNQETGEGILRHLYLRFAEATGEVLITPVVVKWLPEYEKELILRLKEVLPDNKFTLVFNKNNKQTNVVLGPEYRVAFGDGTIEDVLCGVRVRLSPAAFYQVNHAAAEELYSIAASFAEPDNKTLIDLYCGVGTIGLSMAKKASRVIGVEIVEQAVRDAEFNAKINGFDNARFICADAASAAKKLAAENIKPDVVILDPPRKGCDESLIATVSNEFTPERIVYVSCDPATLARDLSRFKVFGYETIKLVPVDLFPNTSHVETVSLLIKAQK